MAARKHNFNSREAIFIFWSTAVVLFLCCHLVQSALPTVTPSAVPDGNTVAVDPTVPSPTTYQINVTSDTNTTTNISTTPQTLVTTTAFDYTYLARCPDGTQCQDLGAHCIECQMNHYCTYGAEGTAECTVKPNITCMGEQTFTRPYSCRYCYQLDRHQYHCNNSSTSCVVKTAPQQTYLAACTVKEDILCLGNRTFYKKVRCNWTSGYKWSTALVLSVTLGGFGVDRFYLGLWREGIGKLFSFGGLGVWTLVDVILVAVGYIGPYDGSLYIYPWD